jgi:hypothetical protein
MSGKKEFALRSCVRSLGQKGRQEAVRKAKEEKARKQAEEFLNNRKAANRSAIDGVIPRSNRSSAAMSDNERDAGEDNWMMEETANLEGQDQVNNNDFSFEDAAICDHQIDHGGDIRGGNADEESDNKIFDAANNMRSSLANDIRNFFIPVADNFANREEASKAVQLFEENYQNSSLTGHLADSYQGSQVAKKKRKNTTASSRSMNNEDGDEFDAELLRFDILSLEFDESDDDEEDEDYNPENYLDAALECYDNEVELDDEQRAEEEEGMDEGDGSSSSIDDDGTLYVMQENDMELEPNPYEGFDILDISIGITQRILQQNHPSDDDDPLMEGSNSTKGEFCRDIQAFLTVNNIGASKVAKDALIQMLYKHIPDLNLPIYLNRRKNQCQKLDSYVDSDLRNISFDCCKSGCTVYVGKLFADLDHCANISCQSRRYLPCAKEPCKSRPNHICGHSKKNRVAVQKLYYRPIIPLIAILLKTEGFLIALQYEYVQYSGQQFGDLSYGSNIKKHLKEMKEDIFEAYFTVNGALRQQDYVFVPLLFGKNYDGVQVYSSRHSNFHPLFLSILNLPPSYRNKAGKY